MKKSKILFLLAVVGLIFTFGFIKINKVEAADINFVVDSLADDSDAELNGVCATSLDECTLRAALGEGNYDNSEDHITITFDESIWGGTINLEDELPGIEHDYTSILGPGEENLTIDGSNAANIDLAEYGLAIRSNNINISGLNIQNFTGNGVGFWGYSNINISNNTISGNDNCGIGMGGSIANVTIVNNKINNNKYQGVLFWTGDNTNISVTGNIINDNVMRGIQMHDTSGNIITDNQIFNNQMPGVVLEVGSYNNTISNNHIYNNETGILIADSENNEISSNEIHENITNGIYLNDSNNNEISSNNIIENGTSEDGYWGAGVSIMKYGSTAYDGLGADIGYGPILEPVIMYAGSDMSFSIVSSGSNVVSSAIESDGEYYGGFDVILLHYPQNEELFPVMEFAPHGLIPNLAVAKLMIDSLIPGGTVEAMLQNVLTKSGDTWTYNGIENGVNGVVVETDGEEVTLATEVEPSLIYQEGYSPYSGIVFNGTSSSNILDENTIEDNGNGISFFDESTDNIVNDGSITSYSQNAISDTTGTNTLSNVDFNRDQINVISGTLIILPEINEIPRSRTSSSGSSPVVMAQFQAEQQARAGLTPTPDSSCLPGYAYSPTTGLACPQSSLNQPTTTCTISTTLTRTLKLTSPRIEGDDIKALQTYLNCQGYSSGIVDGIYGSITKQAVIQFQLANNLEPDGIVGPITQSYLK